MVLRDKFGIEIVRLKITAAGHILDLRYRVIDPVKSFPVFDTKIKPVLIDEQTGRDLTIYTAPRIGGMRQKARRPEAGRVYFILFSNPAGLVKEGNKVTLKIEDVKVEHIRVEDSGSLGEKTIPVDSTQSAFNLKKCRRILRRGIVKLIMAVFLIFGIFLQLAGAQNQAGTSAASQQAIGKEFAWDPPQEHSKKLETNVVPFQLSPWGVFCLRNEE